MTGGSSVHTLSPFGGTSAAASVVSGVVAMMRSANPGATWDQITAILVDNAWTQNPPAGGRVGRWRNAYAAVLAALGGWIRDDASEAGDNPGAPRYRSILSPNRYPRARLSPRRAGAVNRP